MSICSMERLTNLNHEPGKSEGIKFMLLHQSLITKIMGGKAWLAMHQTVYLFLLGTQLVHIYQVSLLWV